MAKNSKCDRKFNKRCFKKMEQEFDGIGDATQTVKRLGLHPNYLYRIVKNPKQYGSYHVYYRKRE